MSRIEILNNELHRRLTVNGSRSAHLGDARHFVPVIVNEFVNLVPHYPILLSKDSETGTLYCGAMLGIDPGENLFLGEGVAPPFYRPLNLQRGPFYAAGSEVAVDMEHPRVTAGGSEAVFTEDGKPTAYLKSIVALLQELQPGSERTKVFVAVLMDLKLLEPVTVKLGFDDGTRRQLDGLYTIDKDALRNLPDDKVLELFRRGYLQLIYFMIASLRQIPELAMMKNRALAGAAGASLP